MASIRRGVW
nr:unnamed protein product [Callosobruchus chinensis]